MDQEQQKGRRGGRRLAKGPVERRPGQDTGVIGRLGRRAAAAADAGWEKTSAATAGAWDKAGQIFGRVRTAFAKHPVSPLLYLTVLVLLIGWAAFHGSYTRAYVLEVDGVEMGVLEREEDWDAIVNDLEDQVSGVLGEDYAYDGDVTLTQVYTAADTQFADAGEIEAALFNDVDPYVEAWAISVNGQELGYGPSETALRQILDQAARNYITDQTVSYEFVEDVKVYPVTVPSNTAYDLDAILATITSLRTEDAYYEVKKGDTFNAIAYSLGMDPNDLSGLNPEVEVNKLWVGDQLLIQQEVPYLSVVTHSNETAEKVIESPIEYIETADLYIGKTSVKEQGEDGLALVTSDVVYLNGVEQSRTEVSSEVIKEATTTYMYTGTTPKPTTASNGYYTWPVRGTITSYFGYRWIGYRDNHLGLDIGCPYGTTIKAADGGEVTWAGWKGSYGNLVIITHDNGQQTYYGHNSSLLVSVGQRVYQGQAIAKAGATGNATGPHCHFEIRINGTVVNPLKYLS